MIKSSQSSPHTPIKCTLDVDSLHFPPLLQSPFLFGDAIMTKGENEEQHGSVARMAADKTQHLSKPQNERAYFPADFDFPPYTIIVGRGKISKENPGNNRLRVLASAQLSKYAGASDKRTKTRVVNDILECIESAGGMFIKRRKLGGWAQVDNSVAREKIGYVFRDLLGDKYKSSSKSKVAKRFREQTISRDDAIVNVTENLEASSRMSPRPTKKKPTIDILGGFSGQDDRSKGPSKPRKTTGISLLEKHLEMHENASHPPRHSQSVSNHGDFDAEELLNSPLIDPEP